MSRAYKVGKGLTGGRLSPASAYGMTSYTFYSRRLGERVCNDIVVVSRVSGDPGSEFYY